MFIESGVINANAKHIGVFLEDQYKIGNPCPFFDLFDESSVLEMIEFNCYIFTPWFIESRQGCLTGLAFGSTFSECSTSSLGTPGMSTGHQAKISQRSWRNLTSALSYAEVRSDAIENSFLRVSWMDPNFLCVAHRVEILIWQDQPTFGSTW
jgi:hypothetical protein